MLTSMTPEEQQIYLASLSADLALDLAPCLLFLAVIMAVGVVGNLFVLVVYLRKFQPSSIRSAILSLAALDLVTCLVSIPGEMLDLMKAYR